MKQAEFTQHIESLSSTGYDTTKVPFSKLRDGFKRLRELLNGVHKEESHSHSKYSPVWISMEKEPLSYFEGKCADIEDDQERKAELDCWLSEFEYQKKWYRCSVASYKEWSEVYLHIGNLSFCFWLDEEILVINKQSSYGGIEKLGWDSPSELITLIKWAIAALETQYVLLREMGGRYYDTLDVSNDFRFSYMSYDRFCEFNKDEKHLNNLVIGELSKGEQAEYLEILGSLKEDSFCGTPLTQGRYFEIVSRALTSAGLTKGDMTYKEHYSRYSDGRTGGLLDIEKDDHKAFSDWFHSAEHQGCHPYEIVSGFSSDVAVTAYPEMNDKGYFITLGTGSSLYRVAMVMRMAIALCGLGIPVHLVNAQKYAKILSGEAAIGFSPCDAHIGRTYLFPNNGVDIVQTSGYYIVKEMSIPESEITPYPLGIIFS